MTVAKTMLEVSKELNISKDLVKYHRKYLSESDWFLDKGKIMISVEGVEKIKGRLRKSPSSYSDGFETAIINRLVDIQVRQASEFSNLRDKIDDIYDMLKKLDL